jgi:hypothetical protein
MTLCNNPLNGRCSRKCARTFCKKGCLYDDAQFTSSQDIVAPSYPPTLTFIPESDYDYTVQFPSKGAISSKNNVSWVNFLFKVQDIKENITRYYWQTDLIRPLKLLAFSCRQVNISMAVVTSTHITPYSPSITVCLTKETPKVTFPLQIATEKINVSYHEDDRYFGYAAITVAWEKPQDYQAISSYSIYVLSLNSKCGGVGQLFTYEKISKNATQVTIKAKEENNFPRFGCIYQLILKVYPSPLTTAGTQVTITPSVPAIEGKLELTCSLFRMENYPPMLTLNWHLPNEIRLLKTILRYVGTIDGDNAILNITADGMKTYYMHSLNITNISTSSITITLTPELDPRYYWRTTSLPPAKCHIELPPFVPLNISVHQFKMDNSTTRLNLTWVTSDWSTHIEIVTGYNLTLQPPFDNGTIVEAELPFVILEVDNTRDTYLWTRSVQNGTFSSWNKPLLIKSSNNEVIPYKPLCSNNNQIDTKLNKINDRLEVLLSYVTGNKTVKSRLDSIEDKLNAIIKKLK